MNIAVYCSARQNLHPQCAADAQRLGTWIGANGHMLVYGGLSLGLMDTVASATAQAGGKVLGVVPELRADLQHPDNTVSIPVATLHQRKEIMEENAQIFVALDGGFGTLDEIMAALASTTFFHTPRPILLLNRDNLYSPLLSLFENMADRGLLSPQVARSIELFPTIDLLIQRLDQLTTTTQP